MTEKVYGDAHWTQVPKFPNYMFDEHGRVMSFARKKPRLLTHGFRRGYPTVWLTNDSGVHPISIHRLIAERWIPNPNHYPEINHKDNNRLNLTLTNLEWCTTAQNTKHAYDIGAATARVGMSNGRAWLTPEQVSSIREYLALGWSQRQIAKQFGCSQQHVSDINRNRRRQHA